MYYYAYGYTSNDYLCHYGVQGMKWGQHLMAKYETNRAGRALRRAASANNKGNYAKRANRILSKYEGKYSKSEIADAALRTGNRQRRVINTAATAYKGLTGAGSAYGGVANALVAIANPTYAVTYAAAAASSVASGIGGIAVADVIQRSANTSINAIDSAVTDYAKSKH